ncbi:MAG: DUF3333 domain-containing protein, partial [Sphingobium yanoikuyae]|nr:DUF3333 domain-containing protein [Sphingobium yanoikuyae]
MSAAALPVDAIPAGSSRAPTDWKGDAMRKRIARRYAAERRFRLLGLGAVLVSAGFLAFLLISMMSSGLKGFTRTEIALPIDFVHSPILIDPAALKVGNAELVLANANLPAAIDDAARKAFGANGADMLSPGAVIAVRKAIIADPSILSGKATIRVPA